MIEALLLSGSNRQKSFAFTQTPLADRPLAASHTSICYYEGKIYAYGGLTTSVVSSAAFHVYDIATNTWTTLATPNSLRRSASIWAYDGNVYVYGGWNQASNSAYNTLMRYNIATNTWTTTGLTGSLARADASHITIDNWGVAFGGYAAGSMVSQPTALDMTTGNSWSSAIAARTGFRYSGIGKAGNDIYLVGGIDVGGTVLNNQCVRYNTVNNLWTVRANLPTVTHSANLLVVEGHPVAYVSHNDGAYGSKIYTYNPVINTWTDHVFNGQIHGLAGSVQVGNSLYILGGFDGSVRTAKFTRLDVEVS